MRLLLINPPWNYPKKYFSRSDLSVSMPMGLMYIAAMVEKEAKVRILDAFTLDTNLVKENSQRYHVGATFKRMQDEINRFNPDLIGITSPFTSQVKNALRLIRFCKEELPDVPVVMGGPHASVMPKELLDNGVDICALGEAEDTFLEIIRAVKAKKSLKKIPGVALKGKTNQKTKFIENLDELPFPAYHLIDMERYFELYRQGFGNRPYYANSRAMPMITSRGCPYNCCFCSIHLHMGRKWRAHSADYVVRHLKLLYSRYHVKHISFEDDNLTMDTDRFLKILEGIQKNNIKITWDTPNGVRADRLTLPILRKAKKTGCRALVVGIESGEKRVLDKIIRKSLDLRKVEKVLSDAKKVGLLTSAFFMIGLPGETRADIQKTLRYALYLNKKYDCMPSVTFAAPLIGTEMYETAKEKGYMTNELTPERLMLASHTTGKGIIRTEEFDPDYLKQQIDIFYKKLFSQQMRKPRFVFRRLRENPKMFFRLSGILMKKILKLS